MTRSKKKKMTKKNKIILSLVFAILSIFVIVLAVVKNKNAKQKEASSYQTMEIQQVDSLLFKGSVEAEGKESVYADPTLGKIETIHVQNGQAVKAGDVLLTYVNETQQEQVDQQARSRNTSYSTIKNLESDIAALQTKRNDTWNKWNKANNASAEDPMAAQEALQYETALDGYDDSLRSLRQNLSTAQSELDNLNLTINTYQEKVKTDITAPIEGTVYIDEAGRNNQTIPLMQIVSPSVTVRGQVSEYDYGKLTLEQPVDIKIVSTKETIPGRVTAVDQLPMEKVAADPNNLVNYQFTVTPDKPIQYGYTVQINVPQNELRVPEEAIISNETQKYVYVMKGKKVTKQPIQTTIVYGMDVVTEGLKKGDLIVANPDEKLKDGQEIEAKKLEGDDADKLAVAK